MGSLLRKIGNDGLVLTLNTQAEQVSGGIKIMEQCKEMSFIEEDQGFYNSIPALDVV
jgi:hypothetical protein